MAKRLLFSVLLLVAVFLSTCRSATPRQFSPYPEDALIGAIIGEAATTAPIR
jgi:hypothetical protein